MSKLFRGLRKSFIAQGSTGKYFKYAIGEILLVVLGILIALQVSNWNQNRKKEQKELEFLAQINQDLEGMLNDIDSDLFSLQMGDQSHFRILDFIHQDLKYQDSLCFDFYWLMKDEYIYPVRSTYDAMKEEGLAIIQNENIRQKIQASFENIFPRISKANPFYPDIEEFFSDYLQEHFRANNDMTLTHEKKFPHFKIKYPYGKMADGKAYQITIGYVPIDPEQLKKDDKFSVLMRQAYTYRTYKMNRYAGGQQFVRVLVNLIKQELETRNK